MATNFQFVEPLSVSRRSPRNRRGPASVRLQAAWRCRSIVRPVDHDQRQQAESPLHDVATNFQFVEPPSVSRHCPTNPTRSTVPRRTSLKTCSTIVSRRSEGNRRRPASPPIFRTKVAVGCGDGGWFGAVRRVSTGLLCGPRPATDRLKTYRKAQRPPGAQIRARRGQF